MIAFGIPAAKKDQMEQKGAFRMLPILTYVPVGYFFPSAELLQRHSEGV
jgi:hypothetical protein